MRSSSGARIIRGHGAFGWVEITSIMGFAHAAIAAQGRLDKPFLIGGYEGDACANGEVTGLDPAGDGFLSVRSGPGGKPFSEVDRLHNGDEVYLCGKEGPWFKVVYHESRKVDESCAVSTASPRRRTYNGPCRRGWAHSRYIKVTAE